MNLDNQFLCSLFTAESLNEFYLRLEDMLDIAGFNTFSVWSVKNNIAFQVCNRGDIPKLSFDIMDLGYNGSSFNVEYSRLDVFQNSIEIYSSFFMQQGTSIMSCIVIHEHAEMDRLRELSEYFPYLSKKNYELVAKEKRSEIYLEYQKKIDFIKHSSQIFKIADYDTILDRALSFFMDVFSSEAGALFNGDKFYSIGVSEEDMSTSLFINNVSAKEYVSCADKTEYIDEYYESDKYNVKNVFIVHEQRYNIKIVLFNIHTDFYPDKEFSDLVSHIVSIALENAQNQQRTVDLKVEESEMSATVDILNKFAKGEISVIGTPSAYGISKPAKKAGGDFLYCANHGTKTLICLADVCGKGYSAAVVTVAVSVMSELATLKCNYFSVAELACNINRMILSKKLDGRFVTAFFGIYDVEVNTLEYISLGHEPAFLYRKNGYDILKSEYLPMGIMEEEYISAIVNVFAEDELFVYSDGVIEYTDYDNLFKWLDSEGRMEMSLESKIHRLYDMLVSDKNNQLDDFTCMTVRF